ncbi:MAG: hypothetical protein ACKVS6_11250 [Planctomycetota bacterium]
MRGLLRGALLAKRAVTSRFSVLLPLLSVISVAAACASAPVPPPVSGAAAGIIESRFEVLDSSTAPPRVAGYVAKTRFEFESGSLVLWLVENEHFQEAGYIDEHGRAFRKLPFEDAPRWVATASMEECVRELLQLNRPVKLTKLAGGLLPEGLRGSKAQEAAAVKEK